MTINPAILCGQFFLLNPEVVFVINPPSKFNCGDALRRSTHGALFGGEYAHHQG